ncbi:HIT-like protein [Rhizoclosmatium globosum]|uniref:HIT-like protein n=1 Tax=Rhizoclosmatium globosum TaxID=329046 RepID=A0A1Y2D2A6_9FUNG|nr:HIT-like protein [Rhizoclosmatium globosum]|eukprot:ORY53246.1 HIT-like protein [Rhizoclosmatium globosum]
MATNLSSLRVLLPLYESTTSKSTGLLLTSLSQDETNAFDSTRAKSDVNYLIAFCTEKIALNPSAFSIAMADKSAYTEADHALITAAPVNPSTDVIAENDIYLRYLARFESTHKLQFIHPCTLTHIRKYVSVPFVKILETPEKYNTVVKKYIDAIPKARTSWIDKIVKREAEVEDLLYSEEGADGFVILPDSKWDQRTIANLYLLVIAADGEKLKSLRDLRGSNVSFLKKVKGAVEKLVKERYGISANGLRLFVHYQPSYYHFHVHVVNAQVEPTGGMAAGQAHLLEDIIDNLQLDSLDYTKRTLAYFLPQTHELVGLLKE